MFPHLRFLKGVIDYFLAYIVFPKGMRDFPLKLSASGWDLVQKKCLPTTGFSGTKDAYELLPLSINHLDLEGQRSTNALVLRRLLQPENSVSLLNRSTSRSDAGTLLDCLTPLQPQVRVILDVGAQVLDLSNKEMTRAWLERNKEVRAGVCFNDRHELEIIDRKGFIEPLQTSPFATQRDECVVFLDDTHTRGTDLKLPTSYRAAVTLGANLTKDRLVQGML